jgi:hypothetical protein
MASLAAKAKREFIARERMETAVAILSGAYGIERTSAPKRPVRDKELKQVIQLEETAAFLEMLIVALGVAPEIVEDKTIGFDSEGNPFTSDDLKNATVKEIDPKSDAELIANYIDARDKESAETTSKPRSTRRSR